MSAQENYLYIACEKCLVQCTFSYQNTVDLEILSESVQISKVRPKNRNSNSEHHGFCEDASFKKQNCTSTLACMVISIALNSLSASYTKTEFQVCVSVVAVVALCTGYKCSYKPAKIQLVFNSQYLFCAQCCFDDWKAYSARFCMHHTVVLVSAF